MTGKWLARSRITGHSERVSDRWRALSPMRKSMRAFVAGSKRVAAALTDWAKRHSWRRVALVISGLVAVRVFLPPIALAVCAAALGGLLAIKARPRVEATFSATDRWSERHPWANVYLGIPLAAIGGVVVLVLLRVDKPSATQYVLAALGFAAFAAVTARFNRWRFRRRGNRSVQ